MILVTVGSTLFPFQRMTTLVEHLIHIRPANEKIIFQYGHTPPHFLDPEIEPHAFMPHRKLIEYMRQSRVIICHGGPATIYQALSFGKIPWVLPRQKHYGEHLNDHQVDFAKFMANHHLIRVVTPKTSLIHIVTAADSIDPIQKKNPALIRYLDTLIHQAAE
ncbi:glycosyltransferase [Patescibacteria group bacterium]|nr:glycosyltransferase [Patescibacteria group bacterium]